MKQATNVGSHGVFFARLNDDGTYSEPIPLPKVVTLLLPKPRDNGKVYRLNLRAMTCTITLAPVDRRHVALTHWLRRRFSAN